MYQNIGKEWNKERVLYGELKDMKREGSGRNRKEERIRKKRTKNDGIMQNVKRRRELYESERNKIKQ